MDVKPILQAGADGAQAAPRITIIAHPADPTLTVPAVLDTPGASIRLAKDVLDALDARRPGPARRTGTTQLTVLAGNP